MPAFSRFAKPEKRATLRDAKSMVQTVAVLSLVFLSFAAMFWLNDWLLQFSLWTALLTLFGIGLVGWLLVFGAAYAAHQLFSIRADYPEEFGRLELVGDELVLFDESNPIGRIDAVQPYEYRILDRFDAKAAVFRLYQGPSTLTFRFSDPGAARIVREVMGLTWPPPPRHAGRSYPPPAV